MGTCMSCHSFDRSDFESGASAPQEGQKFVHFRRSLTGSWRVRSAKWSAGQDDVDGPPAKQRFGREGSLMQRISVRLRRSNGMWRKQRPVQSESAPFGEGMPWWHNVGRSVAERLLIQPSQPVGAFLVRPSSGKSTCFNNDSGTR